MKDRDQKLKIMLGKRIRSLRLAKGWTQQELGEKADINYKFLGEVERGKQNPSFGLLAKISDAFNIELIELCRFSHELASRDELEIEITRIIKGSSDDELRQAILLLNALFPFNRDK
jgi:transcriptional regulator with XRE-family HTH domain